MFPQLKYIGVENAAQAAADDTVIARKMEALRIQARERDVLASEADGIDAEQLRPDMCACSFLTGLRLIILPNVINAECVRALKGLALPCELLQRDRPDGLTSPAFYACGSASPISAHMCHIY